MVIPLVLHFKRFHSACDFVFGERFKFCQPMWIDRPIGFKISTDPIQETLTRDTFGNFDTVVNTSQSNAAPHDAFKFFAVCMKVMPSAPVAINDNGVGIVSCGWIGWPAVFINGCQHVHTVFAIGGFKCLCQKQATGVVFVRTVTVAFLARDKDNLFCFLKRKSFQLNVFVFNFHWRTDVNL